MKKILLIVFLLVSVIANTNAQKINFDSLKQVLAKKSAADTSRVTIISKLQDAYSEYKPDSSIYYAKQLIEWATKHNDPSLLAATREGIAFSLYIKGDYAGALNMALSGLPYMQTSKDAASLANTYNLIGNIYKGQENYPKAISYYRICLHTSTAARDTVDISYAAFNLGQVFTRTNVIDSAMYYLKKAAIYDHVNHNRFKDVVLDLWGDIYIKRKDYKKAITYLQQSYTLAKKRGDVRTQATTCISLSNYYKQVNNTDSVIYWAKEGLKAAKIVSTNKIVYQSADLLSSAYGAKHQTDSALKYLKLSSTTKDSLYSTSKFQAIDALNAAEASRNAQIADAEAAYQNNLRFYLMLFVIAMILLAAFFLWRNSRNQRKANQQLNKQNEEILAQRDEIGQTLDRLKSTQTQLIQSEKMASLGELTAGIAHEIQNPLNFVNNFSDVSAELIDEMDEELDKGDIEEARAIAGDIKQNLEKIRHHGRRADSIVKGMLEHSRTGGGEKQMIDMNALADEFLRLSYHGLRAKDKSFNADMITHFDPELPKISVIPQDMGRVMLNLFNNAFYAVNQKSKIAGSDYKPTITITTFAPPSGGWGATVSDNGTGMPEHIKEKIMQPFFTTKPTGEGTGLGLSLTYDMVVKGHGGSIQVNSVEGEGSEFIIQLPGK